CGVDWGYEHYGAIVVIGVDVGGSYYIVEEHAHQHKDIDQWVSIAKNIKLKYGNIPFYCDSARPEYVVRFSKIGRASCRERVELSGAAVAREDRSEESRVE